MDTSEPEGIRPPVYITANVLMESGISLPDAARIAGAAGADGFELRAELLGASPPTLGAAARHLLFQMFHGRLHFSTPVALFADGIFDRLAVEDGLTAAVALDCSLVKFAPGMLPDPDSPEVTALSAVLMEWEERVPSLRVTLENDQTAASADPERWATFLASMRHRGAKLAMTFDLGNWTCVGVDAQAAARILAPYIVYIHAKAVARAGERWVSRPVRPADTIHPALALLPREVPRAIEFPVDSTTAEIATGALRTAIGLLRSGHFTL